MKSKTEYLTFNTKTKRAFVNITPDVRKIVQDSKIKEGLCLVNAMHITASVFINDNESGLHGDFDTWLEKTVAWYKNNQEWWQDIKNGVYKDYYAKQYGQ